MGKITHDLLPKQRLRKHNLKVEIDIYPYATELYEELEHIGIINRVKEIPQLGVIKVAKRLAKTRYDYIMLQLYLHQMIKNHLQGHLRWTYNNYVAAKEFRKDYKYIKKDKPSIGDILQLLTIVYNIGHFYNTFTASRAVTMLASKDSAFFDMVVGASTSERFHEAAKSILNSKNYQRLHLLNSILILERCDQAKQSVSLAMEILYAYINESTLPEDSKLKYAFAIFRNVRTVSYMAYDLQIAETPLTIDLCNEKAMILLLQELLSEYNNNQSSHHLVQSTTKLLDDTVYNENSNAICYYKISRKMVSIITKDPSYTSTNYYADLFADKSSILNRTHAHKRDYAQSQILKLTFSGDQRFLSEALLADLEKINNTRVGYYDRHSGEQTILVSIKKNCDPSTKIYAAFKAMKCAVSYLRRIADISSSDVRFILCTKFFLFYLFDENPVVIKPTIDREKCVICTRGKNSRVKELRSLLCASVGTEDENHEVEFLLSQLESDSINDTSITLPASILVYQKDAVGRKLCEFDGMIIHPMRKMDQVVFLEAKNRNEKPAFGKNCLKEKLDKFPIRYNYDDIQIVSCDAYLKYSIQ